MFNDALDQADADLLAHKRAILQWHAKRGYRGICADIEEPRAFFSPCTWGVWALIVSGGDPASIGSRVAGGWVVDSFRRILREHIMFLDPKVSFRTFEAEEEALIHKFIDLATAHIDGFVAGRPATLICCRVHQLVGECTQGVFALARPFTKKLASSKDVFDKQLWKQLKSVLFYTKDESSSSSSEDEPREKVVAAAEVGAVQEPPHRHKS